MSKENNLKLTIGFFINKIFCNKFKFLNSEESKLIEKAVLSINQGPWYSSNFRPYQRIRKTKESYF